MRKVIILSVLTCQFLILGCEKKEESTYPKELKFSEVQTDLKIWIGGVKVNNPSIIPEDIFKEELFQWTEDFQKGLKNMTFKYRNNDDLVVINSHSDIEGDCLIKNDSIFLINTSGNYFIGTGNSDKISTYSNCLLYGIHYIENSASSFSTTSVEPTKVDYILEELNLSELEDMSIKDTIAIMDYTIIYK